MGNCKYCGQKAGFLRSKHGMCEVNYREGLRDMRSLASRAAASPEFNQATLYESLSAIAQSSLAGESDIQAAIVAGWNQAVSESLADGVLTHDEETRLREFRDSLALTREDTRASDARLEGASRDRLMLDARLAALAVSDAETHLRELGQMLEGSGLSRRDQRGLLVQAWEAAVEGTLEDGMLTLDEEAALVRYLHHFDLSARDVDSNGAHRNMIEAAVIREAAEGLVPSRLDPNIQTPFNLMKSEELVWVFDGAKYIETRTRRERRGTSHGLSIRVAKWDCITVPAPSAARRWSGRRRRTWIRGCWESPPGTSIFTGSENASVSVTTRSSPSNPTPTASASCATRRPPSRSHSPPATAGSSTTW